MDGGKIELCDSLTPTYIMGKSVVNNECVLEDQHEYGRLIQMSDVQVMAAKGFPSFKTNFAFKESRLTGYCFTDYSREAEEPGEVHFVPKPTYNTINYYYNSSAV